VARVHTVHAEKNRQATNEQARSKGRSKFDAETAEGEATAGEDDSFIIVRVFHASFSCGLLTVQISTFHTHLRMMYLLQVKALALTV